MSRSLRTTRGCVAATAGLAMVAVSYAGAASVAGAAAASPATAEHHHAVTGRHWIPRNRLAPTIRPAAGAGVTVTAVAATTTVATLAAGTSVTIPTVTITDPGIIPSGDTISVDLAAPRATAHLDTSVAPTVTETGSGAVVQAPSISGDTVTFTVTKSATAVQATYTLSGVHLVDAPSAQAGALYVFVGATHVSPGPQPVTVSDAEVGPVPVAAVTDLLPAYYGPTAPDTAALLFDAHVGSGSPSSVVLASDSEPQDAESANFLSTYLPGPATGILLTDPTSLSAAVTDTFTTYPSLRTVYLVGGTSVISAGVETALDTEFGADHVIRLAGTTAYATNQAIVDYVDATFAPGPSRVSIDYAAGPYYNHTTGAASPTTTPTTNGVKTAIVASGAPASFQDGIVSGPLSSAYGMPVILTSPTAISDAAVALLVQGGYRQVILLGGPAAVTDAVVEQLTSPVASGGAGALVFRVAGADASDTAQLFAQFEVEGYGSDIEMHVTDGGAPNGGVLMARGSGFQDVLAAGAYAGSNAYTPILLTENATSLGAPLTGYLTLLATYADTYSVEAIGGPASVSPRVQADAIAAEVAGLGPSRGGCFVATTAHLKPLC